MCMGNNPSEAENSDFALQRDYMARVRELNRMKETPPAAFVETYGCRQNVSDSEKISGMLSDMGYRFTDSAEGADLVLFNTCAVRENAELKVFGNLGALKHNKRRNPNMLIAVCGCMTQQEHIAETIKKKYKHVDMVLGTHALYRFPQILWEALEGKRVVDIGGEQKTVSEDTPVRREGPPLANIPIMYGCNNFCTYCIVPYVRGRERSRTKESILAECNAVAREGYREVMLLGQNVNSYGKDLGDGSNFAKLLREVCKIPGIERIRFMTSHPKDISDELIKTMAEEEKICNQLHMPIQSGSDRVLKAMNRKYTRAEYMEKLNKIRSAIPNIVLTTDVIVGFPCETREDFEETLDVLREAEFDMIFSFIYSKRRGTPAAEMADCLTDEEKHKNFDEMLKVQNEISRRKNLAYLNSEQKVLIEGRSKTNPNAVTGRTEGGKIVNIKCPNLGESEKDALTGKLVTVKITEAQTWSLMGEIREAKTRGDGDEKRGNF